MKLAIMQPYFFPYIGYFSLMEYADQFILFDTAQYDRKGWMNRNRILKPNEGWQYMRAGVVKPPFRSPIKNVEVDQTADWKQNLLRQLEHYKGTAPYYDETISLVEASLAKPAATLTELNKNTLMAVRDRLEIECPINVFSEMNIKLDAIEHPGQWALRISKALNADEYVNPPGAAKIIFDPQEFNDLSIKLSILTNRLPAYKQHRDDFESGLSIIDVLMFCHVGSIRDMLRDFSIKEGLELDQ
jgi:hypothetical protein